MWDGDQHHPSEAVIIATPARRKKTFLQIGQQLRYFPTMREAIRLIHEEKIIGRPLVIRAQRDSGGSRPRAVEETPQQKTRRTWYADVQHSGDLIVENSFTTWTHATGSPTAARSAPTVTARSICLRRFRQARS